MGEGWDAEPPPTGERPLLFGGKETVEGYYALEELERGTTLQALRLHRAEASLWYRLLTIYRRAMNGTFSFPGSEADKVAVTAWGLQLQLLGLGVGTAKSALDRLLAGYYSQALGDIRHMAETYLHVAYLVFRPDTASRWYESDLPQKNPVAAKDACDLIATQARAAGMPGLADRAETALTTWRLAHKGAHPTPEGIRQTVADAEAGKFVSGPVYVDDFALICFDHGLHAVSLLVEFAAGFSPSRDDLLPQAQAAREEIGEWRSRLMSEDGTVGEPADTDGENIETREPANVRSSVVDMDMLWDGVRRLEGRTLSTTSGRGAFDVVSVDEKQVRVVPLSTGIPRSPIPRWRFERAFDSGLVTPDVAPAMLQRAGVTSRNSAYIAAIIRAALAEACPG